MAGNFGAQFQNLTPEARSAMSACLGTILTELNQIGGGSSGNAMSAASSGANLGGSAGTTTKRGRAATTRGGSRAQKADAGHLGGLAAAGKPRGRRPKAQAEGSTQT